MEGITERVYKEEGRFYQELYYPYDLEGSRYIRVTQDITNFELLLGKIRNIIIFLNALAVVFIGFFSYLYSALLARPIRRLSMELSKMDETSLTFLNKRELPLEFRPLAQNLNSLLKRLKSHITYQKELFVGVAHELKTPLAVIKTKNEVTLLKTRDPEKYQEVLRHNIKVINEMNKMTSSILEIGRAEYAQFEKAEKVDLVDFLRKKAADYGLLAKKEGRIWETSLEPQNFFCTTRITLLNHILQNFVQNAIKFTPEGKQVLLRGRELDRKHYLVEVIDEGPGVADGFDPFAPFVGKGEAKGVGLGLFLAKNAAEALGAHIALRNRKEHSGTVASLVLEFPDR